jgi:hypothetical protein
MNKKLAQEILQMVREDQTMRRRAYKTGEWDIDLDRKHTEQLKMIIRKHDWPTILLVGKKASWGAWLLAQHADHDVNFQKKCLNLLKKAYKDNPKSVDKANIAYLMDRILVNEDKKQLFGTQFYLNHKGKSVPRPIQRIKELNQRRKEYGLDSFEKYLKAAKKYRPSLKKQ